MADRTSLGKEDARMFILMGSILFSLGLVVLLITRIAGIGMTAIGGFLLAVGVFNYLKQH
ncbi:MAG: hypothetical protein GKC03_06205 [Methanomassiliicoccales archaeon]|nr:hypothetical protein [Methanomassiliicoccales archaeon]NYT15292.1 hypothetical protein [Methanomassiliicoccales archaeon]